MDGAIVSDMETYAPGDWVVHRRHGAGQIESCEEIVVEDTKSSYCKIRTHSVTVWLPVEKMNDDWLRPIASAADFRRALKVLRSPPQPMADNLVSRKSRIRNLDTSDSPVEIAKLLRDLWALKKEKKTLSQVEEAALRRFTSCFQAEWAVSLDTPIEEAKEAFVAMLYKGQSETSSH
ncbi:MAG: CarD family transcriptional regulator [Chloroflexota bacterium]|jgi:CarD family transcriptional regulator